MPYKKAVKKNLVLIVTLIGAVWWSWGILFPYKASPGVFNVWVFDVGQGESVFMKEPGGKTILFDGGPSDIVLTRLGEVLPPWQRSIDLMILSHPHSDHLDGLIEVLRRYDVGEVWVADGLQMSDASVGGADFKQFKSMLKEKGIKTVEVKSDSDRKYGDLNMDILYPLAGVNNIGKKDNELNVVLRASYGESEVMLTGDVEVVAQKEILVECQTEVPVCNLESDIMQAPHHGSKYNHLPAFYEAVKPKMVVIPVGKDNSYGHPHQAVLDYLNKNKIDFWRTDTMGTFKKM